MLSSLLKNKTRGTETWGGTTTTTDPATPTASSSRPRNARTRARTLPYYHPATPHGELRIGSTQQRNACAYHLFSTLDWIYVATQPPRAWTIHYAGRFPFSSSSRDVFFLLPPLPTGVITFFLLPPHAFTLWWTSTASSSRQRLTFIFLDLGKASDILFFHLLPLFFSPFQPSGSVITFLFSNGYPGLSLPLALLPFGVG